MKISTDVLRRYTPLPDRADELRDLLDDIGVEVKTIDGDVFNLELLANRGDHYCYAGIAREVHGRTGRGLSTPETTPLQVGDSPVPLRIETPLCSLYTATLLERDPDAPPAALPDGVVAPLEAAGIRSQLAAVDATNLSNLELGQPTHAFDADKIAGAIVVRTSRAGERAWPLFTEAHVDLPEGTLVIADDEKILAVAGVIGCEDSKTDASTTRIVLESAAFDPVAVRKAARALDLHTDAKARFERGSDFSAPLAGAGRVVYLLERHAGWSRVGTTGVAGDWADPGRHIALGVPQANAFLHLSLSARDVADRLERYGFTISDQADGVLMVKVPPHRLWDVEFRADLYEELAKSVGYNEVPSALPPVGMGAEPSADELRQQQAEEVLLAAGFTEVITDGFYGQDARDRLGAGSADHPLHAHVSTLNSLEKGYSLLKNNALAHALAAVGDNLNARHHNVRMYEWTRTFHPDPAAENGACRERRLLWLAACGDARARSWDDPPQPADPFFLKGIVEELRAELAVPLTVDAPDEGDPLHGALHPNRQASIRLDGRRVGILGEVHPTIVSNHRIKRARPCYLELDWDALMTPPRRAPYAPPPIHQPLVRSLAFALPPAVAAGDIAARLHEAGPDWLEAVAMTDVFRFEEGEVPMRAVTFELTFSNLTGDRSAEEVNTLLDALVAAVHDSHRPQGVYQRV